MTIQRHQELLQVAIAAHEALPLIREFFDEPEIQKLIAADKKLRETENELMALYLMEGGSLYHKSNLENSDVHT